MNAAMPLSPDRRRLPAALAVGLLALGLPAGPSSAQESQSAQSFYAGKILKLIVGLPPGGGADAYARLVQRYLGRHIPGAPAILIQNMPGAGSLRSVMALKAAPEDGTVMAHFSSALLSEAITAPERVRLDFRTYAWLGNVSEDVRVCYLRSASGIRDWQDMLARHEVVFGATAQGNAGNVDTALLRNLFGVKVKQVSGYAGSAEKRLAVEKGEIDGDCGGWTSVPDDWLRDRKINVMIRLSPTLVPGMDRNVPFGGDLVRDHGLGRRACRSRGGAARGLRRHGGRPGVPGRSRAGAAAGHPDGGRRGRPARRRALCDPRGSGVARQGHRGRIA
jgi:hypothetical protein